MLATTQYHRRGPDYRFGEQVGFIDIKQTFGFSHVRVGRWVTREETKLAANLVFDSLADLAFMLKLPPIALGLRETVSLAFGHGGRKGVQAHYAPGSRELALAKNAGAGALAHEFWHAFDHYIAPKAFQSDDITDRLRPQRQGVSAGRFRFASDAWLADAPMIAHPLNERLALIFSTVLLSANGQDSHDYVKRAIALDKHYGGLYFSSPTELMARAFEASIESSTLIDNPYLVSGTQKSRLAQEGAYPDMAHQGHILKRVVEYFEPLGDALDKQING